MKIKIIIIFLIIITACFCLQFPAKADTTYDLKAESLTMTSAKCEVNQICDFTAQVKNLGQSFTLNFPISSTATASNYKTDSVTTISPVNGTTINTNDYITFYIHGRFSKIGSASLKFSFNVAGYLTESSASNNSARLTVSVAGHDLNVESFEIYPKAPIVNQNCYILVKVKNNGSYNLYSENGLIVEKLFPDFSVTTSSSTMPSLSKYISPGGYLYYGYEGKFTSAGDKNLSFAIDKNNDLSESDLSNNSKTLAIKIYGASDTDLAIDSVDLSADKIVLGIPLDIEVGIKNIGKSSLTSSIGLSRSEFVFNLPYFDYNINDLTSDDYPTLTSPLNPGDIFHYKIHGAFGQLGNNILNLSINDDKQLLEANYANNATSTTVFVYKTQAEANNFSVISKSLVFASSTTVIISWQTDIKTTGYVNYGRAHENVYEYKISAGAKPALDHTVTLNNLSPGANYSYIITSATSTLEKSEMMSNFSMPEDNVLRITSGPILSTSGKTATASWVTNLASSGTIYYKKSGATSLSKSGSDKTTVDHKIKLVNLAYGQYEYYLSSTSTPGTNIKTNWSTFEIRESFQADSDDEESQDAMETQISTSSVGDEKLYNQLKGKIILKVQSNGEAYYISAKEKKLYYLGRPDDAFPIIRSQGVGITNADLAKIPIGLDVLSGADSDGDGLPDTFEDAIGADKNKTDTDGDGFKDKDELKSNFSPMAANKKMIYDLNFSAAQKGKIFLQVQSRGEAWYVNPVDGKRYFLARPADAFNIMRQLGAGISNGDFAKLAE